MKTRSKTSYSTLYQAFLEIDEGDHREKIRFVEKNASSIANLEVIEYFEIMYIYHNALFEIGKHDTQLEIGDRILEMCIMHHITKCLGEDPYLETIFKKAAALYNVGEYPEAQHVIQELLKLHPDHEPSKLFLINCLVKERKQEVIPFRSVSIVAILSSAVVIAIELLFIRPHAPAYTEYVEILRNALFVIGVLSLISGEVWIRYKAVNQAMDQVKEYRNKREEKAG